MLSNKRSRIFVSFLTLMTFLSVLIVGLQSVGVQAQGPNGVGDISGSAVTAPEATQHRLDAEAAKQTSSNLTVLKSVASSTNIQVGDVQTYTVKVVANATQTNITLKDAIPHFGRFNNILSSSGFSPTFDAAGNEIESASAFTLATNAEAEVMFEVDTTALCGQSIDNTAMASAGGKSYPAMRNSMAWDNIQENFNFEQASVAANAQIEISGSWKIGMVNTPTIGAVSGGWALATNPDGNYTSTNVAGQNYTHVATATLNFGASPVAGHPLYLSWNEYFNANTGFDNGYMTLTVGTKVVTLHNLKAVHGDGSVDTGTYKYQMINLLDHFTAAELSGKQGKLTFNLNASPFDNDFGWYVDDLAVTSCNKTAITVNKIPGRQTCTVADTISDKSGAYTINMSDTVDYCYAVKNVGNTEITTVKVTDDKLKTTGVVTNATASTYPSIIPFLPGAEWSTFTTSHMITEQVLNTGEWTVGTGSTNYSYTKSSTAFTDISSTGTKLEINNGEDVVTMTWPMTFNFFGTTYGPGSSLTALGKNQLTIGNNGSMLFTETNTALTGLNGANTPLPLTGTAATASQGIFPLWDDYADPSVPLSSFIYTQTNGTAPNRTFIIQWTDMRHQGDSSNINGITFQAILHENDGKVEFLYNDVAFGNAFDNGASATIGVNKSITEAVQYSFNGGQTIADGFALEFTTDGAVTAQDTALVTIDSALALELEKTVSDVSVAAACAPGAASTIETNVGSTVHYCYKIKNTSSITFQSSSLTDTHLGTLLTDAPTVIGPGASYTHTESTTIANVTMNTATWTVDAGNYRSPQLITKTTKFENIGFGSMPVGTPVPLNNESHDEEGMIDIGFEFKFYGKVFTDVLVGRNGGMIFNSLASGANDVFPDNQPIEGTAGDANHPMAIFPLWDDLDDDSGDIYYALRGTPGSQRLIVQWDRLLHFENSSSDGTFQVILYEGSNRIDFNYQDVTFGTSSQLGNENLDFGRSATIGLNRDAQKANLWSYGDGGALMNSNPDFTDSTRDFKRNDNKVFMAPDGSGPAPLTNTMTLRWDPLIGSATDAATVTMASSIIMTKTVGTDANTCATTEEITVTAGTTVYYCFTIENTGGVTFTQHHIVDANVNLNNTYNFGNLGPGQTLNITQLPGGDVRAYTATTDTLNTATWTASVGGMSSAAYTDTAKVNVIIPPTAVEITGVTATNAGGQLPLGSLVVGMLLLVAGGYVVHRRRNQ